MSLSLHSIESNKGSIKSKKRIGRGLASRGAKSGRGQKGQKSRSGASGFQRLGIRKLMLATPKLRGFTSPNQEKEVVNVSDIQDSFKKGEVVSPESLLAKKLIAKRKNGVKILGNGDLSVDVVVKGCAVSKSAAEKITSAGGTIMA